MVCHHQNDEHRTAPCPAPHCRNRWKRCQVTGGCSRRSIGDYSYRICFGCKDHPAVRNQLDWFGRQRDVTRRQKQDYNATRESGGDGGSSSGSCSSSPDPLTASGPTVGASARTYKGPNRDSDRREARRDESRHHPHGGRTGGSSRYDSNGGSRSLDGGGRSKPQETRRAEPGRGGTHGSSYRDDGGRRTTTTTGGHSNISRRSKRWEPPECGRLLPAAICTQMRPEI